MMKEAKAGAFGSDELRQRIKNLKERRKCDKINLILYAAARGNLVALKDAMEVNILWYILGTRATCNS